MTVQKCLKRYGGYRKWFACPGCRRLARAGSPTSVARASRDHPSCRCPARCAAACACCRLEAAPGAKHKAAFSVAYGAGLRVSEVANLKVTDNGVGLPLHDSMDDVELDHL